MCKDAPPPLKNNKLKSPAEMMCWPMIWANFDPLRRIPPAQLEIGNKGSGSGKLQQDSTHEEHDQRTGRSVTKQLVAESCFLCLTCRHGQ